MVMFVAIALLAAAVVAAAETAHARRVARVSRLAFGPGAAPALWVPAVPALRTIAVGLATWGLVVLTDYDPIAVEVGPSKEPSRHLVIALDVSPSMHIEDAGPGPEPMSRALWAGRVVQTILDRLDMESTRISIVAFYTTALPVVEKTFDKEVVANILDGLPMYVAFEAGPTRLEDGVIKALETARPWPARSTTLVVVTDGDAHDVAAMTVPDAIADTIIIGVGDPERNTMVSGHASRQDSVTLKQLAARMGGFYHQGNRAHLPTAVLDELTMVMPRAAERVGLREAALIAVATGCGLLALMTPALLLFGRRREYGRQRSTVARRRRESAIVPAECP